MSKYIVLLAVLSFSALASDYKLSPKVSIPKKTQMWQAVDKAVQGFCSWYKYLVQAEVRSIVNAKVATGPVTFQTVDMQNHLRVDAKMAITELDSKLNPVKVYCDVELTKKNNKWAGYAHDCRYY